MNAFIASLKRETIGKASARTAKKYWSLKCPASIKFNRWPSIIPASRTDWPDAPTKNVAVGRRIRRALRPGLPSILSSVGGGEPAAMLGDYIGICSFDGVLVSFSAFEGSVRADAAEWQHPELASRT